jgi:predicted Ser/Thr protein kinase
MIGQTLSHYHILEKLGEGGMGVVYKARDTHLDRFVALKILPAEKVADPDRRRRFVQEAKAASALNHPHIVTIHDIDEADGVHFIAMESVDGKTLDQLIPRHGMRLNEALKVAVQMADALAAAHEAGIVHRDLKPGNLMVIEKGQVKVLDFGLAKLTEKLPIGAEDATLTAKPDTEEGKILGTVAYMSPEQAEGKKVDARSDIFSFGSVLYEMVTGQQAFQGDSKMFTLASIISREPEPLPAAIPHDLEKLITRCLRKKRERRWQTMADLKVALEELKEESDSGALEAAGISGVAVRGKLWWTGVLAAVAVIVIGLGIAGWFWLGRSRPMPAEAPLTAVPLTSYAGMEYYPAFSPDGHALAFFRWPGYEKSDLYLLDLSSDLKPKGNPKCLIVGKGRASGLDWTVDGRSLVYSMYAGAAFGLWRVAVSSPSPPQRLTPIGTNERSPAISRRANRLAYVHVIDDWNIWRMELPFPKSKASPPSKLISTTRSEYKPQFSPDGKKIAFVSDRSGAEEVWVCDADGANAVQLTRFGGEINCWMPR